MSTSNVRNIETLATFHGGLIRLSGDWDKVLQEMRMMVHRTEDYFTHTRPAYWRDQIRLAERELNEAKDNLSMKRSAARAEDRPAATEARQRVAKSERRLRLCQAKEKEAKSWALVITQQCDEVLGPLADVSEHCDSLLPRAAQELASLIEQLRIYAEQADKSAGG